MISLYEIELAVVKYYNMRKYIIVPNISWGFKCHECDLFIINSSDYVTEVEIKRSKADLKKDVEKKHQHKDDRIKYLYFAIPIELKDCIDLIPEHAGILLCEAHQTKKGWRYKCSVLRKAVGNNSSRKLTVDEKFKIMRLGVMRIWSLKDKIVKIKK